jgi:hypothetical protein
MILKRSGIALFTLVLIAIAAGNSLGQGGWRQWEIYLVDGTSVQASPLQIRADGRFTRSMDPKEDGYSQDKINYLAASTKQLPPFPTGKYKQDLVIMLDGKQLFGNVTFKSLKFSEGTIEQNGKEMSLEDVAYIKFAHTKAAKSNKPAH